MIASFVLFSLAIGPDGYVLSSAHDGDLVSLAVSEFEQGVKLRDNAAKARPRFRESARLYDELWRRGYRDANLALNRAHARRLAGDLPGAIVAHNEGLTVARWSRPLQVALEDARSAVAYPIHSDLAAQCRPVPARTIGTRMSPGEAKAIVALLWLFACGGIARFAMTRAGSWLGFAGMCVAGLALLGGCCFQEHRVRQRESEYPLVVLADDVHLRKGNDASFPRRLESAPALPKGVEAHELSRRSGWIQVRLANGVIGWIPEATVLKGGE